MRVPATILAIAAAAALAPASAHAATAYMESAPNPIKAFYDAAPGEKNQLTVTYDHPSRGGVTLHDARAGVHAVAPCEPLDEHTVHCPSPALPEGYHGWPDRVTLGVRLGDGDDSLTTDSGGEYPFGTVAVSGGKGDDVLAGGDGMDRLDGGSGADRISGGGGSDFLSDGDRTGQSPKPDMLDGGPSAPLDEDTVSYEHRTAGVTADLVHGVGGEAGEGDTLTGFESAVGGSGDDRLTGGSQDTVRLTGNAGDDTLTGGPGFSVLTGGDGNDVLASGPYINVVDGGAGLDAYRCGGGEDHVMHPAAGEFLGPACDEVDFSEGEFGSFRFPPQPVRTTRRAAWFKIACPSPDSEGGDFEPCAAVLKIRGGRGNRVLGRAAFEERKPTYPVPRDPVKVPLTRLGRRLAARRHGVVATVTFRESTGQTVVAWTVRLRTRH